MSRYVDTDVLKAKLMEYIGLTNGFERAFNEAPTIEIPTWIPCSERLPEEPFGCLVTVYWEDPYSGEYYQIYHETVGYDGEGWNNADGWTLPYEVIAWMPLPEPYKEGVDDEGHDI